MTRRYAVYLITEIVDVHGNWVRYDYTNDSRTELTRIYSNDGRDIRVQYNSAAPSAWTRNSRRISRITTNGRTWSYNYYSSSTLSALTRVTLPDGRYWSFGANSGGLFAIQYEPHDHWTCVPNDVSFSLKHPDGAVGVFRVRETRHIKNATTLGDDGGDDTIGHFMEPMDIPHITNDSRCTGNPDRSTGKWPWYRPEGWPIYRVMSVKSKTISGTGIPTATWTFDYRDYTGGPLNETWTKETSPDGTQRTYTYETVGENFGQLKRINVASPSGVGETITYEYDPGKYKRCRLDDQTHASTAQSCKAFSKRPATKIVHQVDGVSYTTENSYNKNSSGDFIDYGRPNRTKKYSTLQSQQRIVDLSYWHNTASNIIGLTKEVRRNGKLFDKYYYDSLGRVTRQDKFGALYRRYVWHTAPQDQLGTVAFVDDALNRRTEFWHYKRGVPQQVIRPDNISLLRTVDNNGWVTSQTNARGVRTNYQYNPVGWLTKIDRPAPWADTTISYTGAGTSNFYQRLRRGTTETVTWYDGLLRPWRVRNKALSGGGLTTYVKTSYDALGRVVFSSFPATSSNPTQGTETTYDALGRVTRSRETVAPFATTTTAYLSGNRTRVTDPEGNVTTTTGRGFGSPNDGNVVKIEQPQNVVTDMTYDIYGNIVSARQYEPGSGVQSIQRWSYDGRLRLCRHTVPETGDSLYQYDTANQLIRRAEGQPAGSGCATPPAKISYAYDSVGRLIQQSFPAGNTYNINYTYDGNGNVTRIARGSTEWTYQYDSADQLTEEKLAIDGRNYLARYTYNSIGAPATYRSPSSRVVDYAPNGLGQPTKVRYTAANVNYATNATYHLNGAIKSFTYGNGLVRENFQNARQLTTEIKVSNAQTTPLRRTYSHDSNGRITFMADWNVPNSNQSYAYDGLGRLQTTNGPWGFGAYTYDALNNLRQKRLGNRIVQIVYDDRNRVSHYRDTAASGNWQLFGYDSRGNVIDTGTPSEGGLRFTYDLTNQPISMMDSATGTFVYDGNYKRVKQTIDGKTIYSFYSQSGQLLHRDNPADGGDRSDYLSLSGMTFVRLKGGGSTYKENFLHTDHLGTPVAATDSSANLLWRESHTPFGEKRLDPKGNRDETGFTGHIEDAASGLTYMQARYYHPVIGRFLSNDPVGFVDSGFNPQMFNRYSYVGNDPINKIDPDGRVGKVVRFLRNLKKADGNPIKAGAETIAGIADNIGTLTDGQLTGDDVTAAIDLVSGLDKKDQRAIKGATAKARSAIKRRTSREAQRNAGVATSKPGRDTKGRGFKEPRSQIKEGGASNGSDAGITDGSRDFNNDANHKPGMEAGEIKRNGPQTNSNGVPWTIGDTKGKSNFDDN